MISHELLAASVCNLCVTTFSTPANLKKHLRNVHDHKPTISNGKDFNKRINRSNYIVKDIESEAHGKKLYRAIIHTNAYHI